MTSTTAATGSSTDPRATADQVVRDGVVRVLFIVAAILLGIAGYYLYNIRALATVEGTVPETWTAAFRSRDVWPVLVWSALCGLAACAAGGLLIARRPSHRNLNFLLAAIHYGAAAAMAAIPIYLLAREGLSLGITPVFVWATLLFLIFATGGIFLLSPKSSDPVSFRLGILSVGGAAGLVSVMLGFALPLTVYRETFTQGLDAWRTNWPAVFWTCLALYGSLGLMFFSLQLARGLERQNQNVRRLIYGYNAVMTGLLLLAVLAKLNVLAYAEPFSRVFGRSFDWTRANINAMSPALRSTLADLKDPVMVYNFSQGGVLSSVLDPDLQTLLDNCKSISSKFDWKLIPVRNQQVGKTVVELMEKYSIADPNGILIVVGKEEESAQPAFTFIKARDLIRTPNAEPGRPPQDVYYSFLGDSALLGALQSMLEGQMTIYMTQGHGEWSTEGPPPPRMPRGAPPGAEGPLSTLKSRLTTRRGVDVRPLTLNAKIPDNASVVVIARPQSRFSREEVAVLRDYLRRNREVKKEKDAKGKEVEKETVTAGRILMLLEPIVVREASGTRVLPTGLEELLQEYNVKVGNNRVLSLSTTPNSVPCIPVITSANAIAGAFKTGNRVRTFDFRDAQTVDPIAEQLPGKSVERLFTGFVDNFDLWKETDFNLDPTQEARRIASSQAVYRKKITNEPLNVAVAVSDQVPGGGPKDPIHAGVTKDTPRMVVFGSAAWVNNEALASAAGPLNMDLFSSCVSWLREKNVAGEGQSLEGKDRQIYSLGLSEDKRVQVTYLPLLVLSLAVTGVGVGVWVVRRR